MSARGAASLIAAAATLVACSAKAQPAFTTARTQYALHCGGCHGIEGRSPPASVPVLRGHVGYFLCTPQGRDYVGRLPNVAHAALSDEALTQVLNFVVFDLGEGSAGAAKPYTPPEVGRLRGRALANTSLLDARRQITRILVRRCGAPRSMLDYSSR